VERLKVDLNGCFMGGQVYTALSRAVDPNYLQIINFSYQRLWCEQKVRDFYSSLTSGFLIERNPKKSKPNYHQEYLAQKAREKLHEFVTIYNSSEKWPYEEIKSFLNQKGPEYYKIFCQVIEKSISNSQNLVIYRELLAHLNPEKQ
jgi:hypothetical protein